MLRTPITGELCLLSGALAAEKCVETKDVRGVYYACYQIMSSCTLCNLEININAGVRYHCIHV